ncbi:Putative ribonuclease H protein At1g65750 [Linum perenne]
MLGKQGWRLLSNPDTLVSRVFKARYFPRGDFLSAPHVKGSSIIWQNIWATQGIVQSGYRWRIGDGTRVTVWVSPWLRSDQSLLIETPRDEYLGGLRVCDLFIPGLKEWDAEMIQALFNNCDATAILSIPLHAAPLPDHRIWHFGKKGQYTVRSCYRLIMERLAPREHLYSPGPWVALWDIQAPPRLRCFAWRVARGVLPTRMALEGRHLYVPSECGICQQDLEHSWHLFLQCPFAQRCWSEAGMLNQVNADMQVADSMQEWLFKLIETGDDDRIARSIAIMGAIWRERNNRVWNAETNEPLAVVRDGLEGLRAWTMARAAPADQAMAANRCVIWHPPPIGHVKCNIDAALFSDDGRHGMGAILRNSNGVMLQYRMSAGEGCPNATECEAMALLDAIGWLGSLGLTNVILEMDSLNIVQAISSEEEDQTELGILCDGARRSMHPSWTIQYARRNGNLAAHTLARHSRYLTSPIVGDTSPPWLIDALNTFCTTCDQ